MKRGASESSSSVVPCGASGRNDWEGSRRVLASVAFSEGGVGKPEEGIEDEGAFLAEGWNTFGLHWEVPGNGRGWDSCGLASVVFSLLSLGLCGGVQRSTVIGIMSGINSRYI